MASNVLAQTAQRDMTFDAWDREQGIRVGLADPGLNDASIEILSMPGYGQTYRILNVYPTIAGMPPSRAFA